MGINSRTTWRIGSMAWALALLLGMITGAQAQSSLLHLAPSGSAEEIADAIRSGEDVNAEDPNGTTVLMMAAGFNEDADAVKLIVEAGAEVNSRDLNGVTPLMYAANFNTNPLVAELLIKAGAEVNLHTVRRITALMFASISNPRPELIHLLLDAGADSSSRDELGNTALDHAELNPALQGTEAYERLLKATSDSDPSLSGNTIK